MLFTIDRLLPQMITQLKIMTDQTFDDMINVETISTRPADDFFYIRTEAFDNEDVKTGMTLTMSPDGKAARFTVAHEGNAMEYRTCRSVPDAIKSKLTETSLAGSKIYIAAGHQTTKTSRSTPLPICSSWRSPRSCRSS